jgi:hypothetical protein
MQRTAQREKAFQATISPNSNSESSTLRGDTRWDEETMPGFAGAGEADFAVEGTGLRGIRVYTQFIHKTLTIYLNAS